MVTGNQGATLTDAASLAGVPTPKAKDGREWSPGAKPENASGHGLGATAQLSSVPTPNAGPQNDGDTTWEQRRADLKEKHGNGNGFGMTLGQAVSLSSVPTPTTTDDAQDMEKRAKRGERWGFGPALTLGTAARLASVTSPSALDWKDSPGMSETGVDPDGSSRSRLRSVAETGATRGFWGDCDWWWGRDGKWRPAGPGIQPLAHGVSGRVGLLRAYGNAIVPEAAAAFVRAFLGGVTQ